MTDERARHLSDVAATLWPEPHVTVLGPARTGGAVAVAEFLVLPDLRRPRLLAPTGRRAAASVVRHHGEGRDRRSRLVATALAWGLRAGLGRLLRAQRLHVCAPAGTSGPTLLGHLSEVLGREVVMGLHLGPARANRKPVVQLLSPEGRTLAYAKVAVDDLTDELVRTEAAALAALADVSTGIVEVAELLHVGAWRGRALLVQSALPVWLPRRVATPERLVAAVSAIAAVGRREDVPLTRSVHWAQLEDRVAGLPPGTPQQTLRRLLQQLAGAAGDLTVTTGGSHGDFTPWNLAGLEDRLLVWDWERFRRDVPVGADLLHHGLQSDLVTRLDDPREAADRMIAGAPALLAPLGLSQRTAVITALLYGADLATRYLADRQQEVGARLGNVGDWLLPALEGGLGRLEEER
jgi:hypothetical protein